MASNAVEATDLGYSYGGVTALEGVSLTIPAGTVTALLGPNGAGKTTFVRLLTGTLLPGTGHVSLFGSPPTAVDRERIGVLPQGFDPPERLSPRELLRYYAGIYDDALDPEEVLDDLGLASVADRPYRKLSGGEQRRCCLGTALVNDPELLVLDEPTARIDPAGKRRIWRYIPSLVDTGTTVILATHDMVEAERLAERVGFFHDGRLIAAGASDELVADSIGQRRLVVETPASDRLVASLGGGVATEGSVHFSAIERDALPHLVDRVVASEVSIRSIRWEYPSLEELFVELIDEQEGDT